MYEQYFHITEYRLQALTCPSPPKLKFMATAITTLWMKSEEMYVMCIRYFYFVMIFCSYLDLNV